ncbi:unnamed protein product [Zymoseptoria tritici ST99CH_3D7]|uniref:non-specific serine/threonine protein kinase n=2 Tax=Zymoseptoria tritici TaxID=1047171 RepID=A0A1X7REV1_ZYMT9|nr:unnamed protein product [Zymoseptoria tritici ST99CH_3D7]
MASEPTPQYDALLAFRSAFISAMARIPTRDNALVAFTRPRPAPAPPPPPPPLPGADLPVVPGGFVWPNPPKPGSLLHEPPQETYPVGAFQQSHLISDTATENRFQNFMAGDLSGSTELDRVQGWQGIQYLAAAGNNMVGLFGQFDANQNMTRRLAVKDLQCGPLEWFMPFNWTGVYDENGVRDYSAQINRTESMETYIHRHLSATGASSIVAFHGRTIIDTSQWRYRFFMEYCPHGSLSDLIGYYLNPRNFPDAAVTEVPHPRNEYATLTMPNVLIPEPFIWYCFMNLAKSAIIMEQGSIQAPIEGWKEVVHRDLKPGNIWLQDPSTGRAQWALYPEPKLGDFGFAFETGPNDPPANNPRAFRGAGTPGFLAPEQHEWLRRDDLRVTDFPRMGAKTNVWAIGSVIYALVFRCKQPNTPDYVNEGLPRDEPHGPLPAPGYSHTLMDLMWECLQPEPTERPSPSTLLKRTFNKDLDFDEIYFKGMRTVKPRLGEPWHNNSRSREHRLRAIFDDEYRLGLSWDDLPPAINPL